jgi:uncharacterized protein YrrD
MIILGSRLIGTPIMGLQTGTQLAITKTPMIDPSNLMIIGYELDGPLLTERPSFIRIADIRELSDVGMIIDSSDEFIGTKDVIAIESIYNLGFKLLGLSVIDESKQKLGKVNDYTVDTGSFVIQQLNINRGMLKSLAETELLVHRTQIIEINNKTIIVRTAAKKLAPIIRPTQLSYLNPFRPTTTQTENSNT